MKKTFLAIVIALNLVIAPLVINAQDSTNADATVETAVDDSAKVEETPAPPAEEKPLEPANDGSHHVIKNKFIEGGPGFMSLVLICLILGLAVAIERIITLFMASGNSEDFKLQIENYLKNGDIEGAKELCRNTPGPIASIYYQGLDRNEEGLSVVESAVASYGVLHWLLC